MNIEIKSRFNGNIIFSVEAGSLKAALEIAVKSGANLYRANLSGANLSGADLSGANLYRANLSGADLSGANLYRADLSGANLYRANLSGANLSGADLSGANLYRANLSGADLSGANLYRADLSGANLYRANLSGADNLSKYLTTPLLILRDQPGAIRAYKLINEKGEGPFNGGINYLQPGGDEVFEHNPDTDELVACGRGINLATLDWCMKEWRPSYRILVMEFTAADIAAIPTATDGKFRVRRCRRVGEKDLKELGLVKEEAKSVE